VKIMNEARFMEFLAIYGAELARWPDRERDAAAAFLEIAPHRVKDVWESERVFDHLLALEKDAPASIALETQILSSSPGKRALQPAGGFGAIWSLPKWATGGALAASLALGFAVGYAGEPELEAATDYASMLTLSGGGAGSMFLMAIDDGEH
jgi:hypothetical protein